MNPCSALKNWVLTSVLIPVSSFFKSWKEACEEFKKSFEEKVQTPTEKFIESSYQACASQACYWWCLCCNKWFCWLVYIIVRIIVWIVLTVIKWVVYLVCKLVEFVVEVVTMVVLQALRWVITFAVCLFTDLRGALLSFRDLWTAALDIVDSIVGFGLSLFVDAVSIVSDAIDVAADVVRGIPLIGPLLAGIVRFLGQKIAQLGNLVRDLVHNVEDILQGVLRLNWCRIDMGGAGIVVNIVQAVLFVTTIPVGVVGGVRDEIALLNVRSAVAQEIDNAFGVGTAASAMARVRAGFGLPIIGLPVHVDAYRCYLSSRSTAIDLRQLDASGQLNLMAAAGLASDCGRTEGRPEARGRNVPVTGRRSDCEVVFARSSLPVDYWTIETYLRLGPAAVPEFWVFPMRRDLFERRLKTSREKLVFLGLDMSWTLGEREIMAPGEFDIPIADGVFGQVLNAFGRVGPADDRCMVPALGTFRIQTDEFSGLTSWYRPPTDPWPSGVAFVDNAREWMLRYVLVHEIGHYFGLDHVDGIDRIMYSWDDSEFATQSTVPEYVFLSAEPRFMNAEVHTAWKWLCMNAVPCLS